jgi:hypothetical protein
MSFGIELKSTILSAVGELKDGRPVNGLKNLVRYPSAFDGNAVRSVQGTATRYGWILQAADDDTQLTRTGA